MNVLSIRAHYPVWSKEVLKYLYEERTITASGHETKVGTEEWPNPCSVTARLQ